MQENQETNLYQETRNILEQYKNPQTRQEAEELLLDKISAIDILDDREVQLIFNTSDDLLRQKIKTKIIDAYGLNGEFEIMDSSGKILTIKLEENNPFVRDETHGWVLSYKLVKHPDQQIDRYSTPVKHNYIGALARFKRNTPKQTPQEQTYKKAA